ncbi:hypothetical protein MBM_02270 [Drepanopeziza brunnea f. sp. 'multigermtubi' MB_m1]|uniref:Uncharacterized protein n=1 Tax=Marssonina brunnea f. sp. multigermtubi (strain MB_m1) TaxID=1072389 RepID=K1XDU3_MARBU|nr:uncharacterized protein MBM_02270 [Drepanopeziza brunnea f. sp. 'multigermtubi' MB_m1]EKD19033.1 hypothetical protein MBM_02270 [Drepanopeziza brunnea f. sp. 'multigermtubi' MB_m1]
MFQEHEIIHCVLPAVVNYNYDPTQACIRRRQVRVELQLLKFRFAVDSVILWSEDVGLGVRMVLVFSRHDERFCVFRRSPRYEDFSVRTQQPALKIAQLGMGPGIE